MKSVISFKSLILLVTVIFIFPTGMVKTYADFPQPPDSRQFNEEGIKTAVLAGGCFWGMEGVFEQLKGVIDVVSGYSGGNKETAVYEKVGTGKTGHAESIRITYDSAQIVYGTLLKVFFAVAHDPTQLNYQGPDHGTEYRSAIFYVDATQKSIAEQYIKILDAKKVFPGKIVTELTGFKAFYPAESYHQNFMQQNPDYPYIVYWDLPKIKHLRKEFPELIVKR